MFPITIAEVVEKKSLTPVVRHVVLTLRDAPGFTFRPGQFIQCVLDPTPPNGLRGAGPKTLRQFSLASLPAELPQIEFCVDISPMGRGSRFIEGLRPGDRVTLRGPFGVFVLPNEATRPLEFVATGAGIAPIRSLIRSQLQRGASTPVTLTFGNRTLDDILYQEEWERLAAQYPHFTFHPALSAGSDTWKGFHGRVTDVLEQRTDLSERSFYICGSPEMVDDTRKTLAGLGIPDTDVHFEKFT